MPRNPKLYIHGTVVFITTRTEEGLPFVEKMFMRFILWGILARARNRYDIKICALKWLRNHLHMIAVVDNPSHVKDFMAYVKTESAHAVNRLLGRKKKTIWCEGYDSPILLTPADVLREIKYIYTNAQAARRCQKIDQYQGLSTWTMFICKNLTRECPYIARNKIPKLETSKLKVSEQKKILNYLKDQSAGTATFVLEPNAWMECFAESRSWNAEQLNTQLIKEIRQEEEKLSKEYKGPYGNEEEEQDIAEMYTPKKYGKRMICICSDIELRKTFLHWFKGNCELARTAIRKWLAGDNRAQPPPGFFFPGGLLKSCLNPCFILW